MKKMVLFIIAVLLILVVKAQDTKIEFIDSLANKGNQHKIILLFSELLDTMDNQENGWLQRNSYYFDWGHKELRYIEVYKFEKTIKKKTITRAFKKNNRIPPANRIIYTFFKNSLVKVIIMPSDRQCGSRSAVYYFFDDMLIFKNENNFSLPNINFNNDVTFFMEKLRIPKREPDQPNL